MLTPLSSVSDFRTAFPALSDIEIHGIKNIFSQFNANKDGKLTKSELQTFLKKYAFLNTDEDVEAIFNELGRKDNGITMETFIEKDFDKDVEKKLATQRTMQLISPMMKGASGANMFEMTAAKFPNRTAIIFEDRFLTWKQVDLAANQFANWASSLGIKKNDLVALNMESRPEFIITWVGISKLGGTTAFINHNLRDKSLLHSVTISRSKTLIFGIEVADQVKEISKELKALGISLYCYGGDVPFAKNVEKEMSQFSTDNPPPVVSTPLDIWGLIYTSGTTGLPKAALMRNFRFWAIGTAFAGYIQLTHEDIIYNSLPLYHSSGGAIGIGMSFCTGAALVIRRKFSATSFWPEVRKYNCTVIQYIGELCRYLLAVPPDHINDSKNKVRAAVGNGLRPEIWEQFQTRFNIDAIAEFYGSTEGNASSIVLVSGGRGRGSMGHRGYLLRREPAFMSIVKFDVENEVPIRGPDGLCIPSKLGESGELIGEIITGNPGREFAGYHGNKEGTEKKLIRDVFKKGDLYFRTGDLVREDHNGYYYFVDRIGDTYRWKGENISTNEVAEVVSVFPGIQEVNVYGVQIPGKDGRAGMCAVVLKDQQSFDFESLGKYLTQKLPSYSIPVFIRILPMISITGTFKHQKVELRNEGINLTKVQDPIYVFDASKQSYVPFTMTDYNSIIAGKSRL